MFERLFKLQEHGTDFRTELLAGGTTFLTMAYIVFLQPAIPSFLIVIGALPFLGAGLFIVVGTRRVPSLKQRLSAPRNGRAVIGVLLTYSIGDGLALGFIAYPVIKLAGGRRREVSWLMLLMAGVLAAYFVSLRNQVG